MNRFFYHCLATALLSLGFASCEKQVALSPATDLTTTSKLTPALTVGLPPAYVWWSVTPVIPFSDGERGDVPSGLMYPLGFAINGRGYVCGGVLYDSHHSSLTVRYLY